MRLFHDWGVGAHGAPYGDILIRLGQQNGFILMPVMLAIVLIATLAFLLNNQSAISVTETGDMLEAEQAEQLAQAGLAHAVWGAQNSGCTGDMSMTSVPFGQGSYTATVDAAATTTNQYSFNPDQDTTILESSPAATGGSDTELKIKEKTTSGQIRSLLHYDLSTIPAGARVTSATAWFYVTLNNNVSPVYIHRVTAGWAEASATWNSIASSYESSLYGMISPQSTSGVWVSVNLAALAQSWVNDASTNHGIMLIGFADDLSTQFTSSEYSTTNLRPYLQVTTAVGDVSPLNITATGTLTGSPSPANDITRSLARVNVPAYQPGSYTTLQPGAASGEDAEIWDQQTSNNYGGATETWVSSASNDTTRSLLRFNMGVIPVGVRILEATLSLNRQSGSVADQPVSAHRIRNAWSEDSVTWDSRETGTSWDTAGGDFDNIAVASTPVGPVNQRYEWSITPLVQGWVDGSYPNFGVALVAAIAGMPGERFNTSDHADPTLWPSLTISYACECGVACLAPQGSGKIALIGDDATPDPDDQIKIEIIESWGYEVDFYQDRDSNTINWSLYDLAYVSETVISGDVSANLANVSIGVVNEEPKLYDNLLLANGDTEHVGSSIDIIDNSHYITSIFPQGALSIYAADMEILTANTPLAGGLQTLGEYSGAASLTATDQGAATTSGTAAGRRVTLPLGQHFASGFNWTQLNNNGSLMVQRAIQWGTGNTGEPTTNLLLVVVDPANLTIQEAAKKGLFESWNYVVTLIDVDEPQAAFDTAVTVNEVVYITEDISSSALGSKLANAPIGVVTEEDNLSDEFGLSQSIVWESGTSLEINNNAHYITSPFATGTLPVMSVSDSLSYVSDTLAPTLNKLASTTSGFGLVTLDAGATTYDGGTTAGRRAQLPWGGNDFDIYNLTADGITILKRSLEWAAGEGCGSVTPLLMMVSNSASPSAKETERKTLMESWCYNVILVDDDATTTDLAAAILITDVIYISQEITNLTMVPKLKEISIGIVNEEYQLGDDFGFATGTGSGFYSDMNVMDNSHYITSGFSLGALALFDPAYDIYTGLGFTLAPGMQVLGEAGTLTVLATLETGAALDGGGTAPGRRVQVPWGDDFSALNVDGQTIMQRAIEWAATVPPLSGPIAHWKLDDATGSIALDSEGGHDGTLSASGPSWTTGQLDGGLEFDGSNDTVNAGSDASIDDAFAGGATITAWIYPRGWGEGDFGRIADKADDLGTNRNGWAFELRAADQSLMFQYGFSSEIGNWDTPNNSISLNTWQHVAVVFDNSSDSNDPLLYINGIAQTVSEFSTPSGTPSSDAAVDFTIGNYAIETSRTFDGTLDDVRLYDRMLDPAEIVAIASGGGGGGGGGGCDGTFRDEFNLKQYDQNDGTLTWATDWGETGETTDPTGGDIRIDNDVSDFQLLVRDDGQTVWREADLTGAASATLSFDYRRENLSGSGDYVAVEVSYNGGSDWTELDRFEGTADDSAYTSTSYVLDAGSLSANTQIRFLTPGSGMGNSNMVWFDNVQIECAP